MAKDEEFQHEIDKIVAESKLSETARKELETVSEEVRDALLSLLASGEIIEKDGKYFAVEDNN